MLLELLAQVPVLGGQPAFFNRPPDQSQEQVAVRWFLDKIVRPETHRLDRAFNGGVAGEHDHLDIRMLVLGLFQDLDPVEVRQHQIGDHQVERAGRERFQAGLRLVIGGDLVVLFLEGFFHCGAESFLIVDQQDLGAFSHRYRFLGRAGG